MKKVLIGCGALMVVVLIGVGGTVAYCGTKMKDVAGDLITAMPNAVNMSLDRMEQDAVTVSSAELAKRILELRLKPVRVRGKIWSPKDEKGNTPQGYQEGNLLLMEPSLIVMAMTPDVLPTRRVDGAMIEVIGIAANVNLAAMPGMNEKAKAQLQSQMGGTDMPMVIARKATLVQ